MAIGCRAEASPIGEANLAAEAAARDGSAHAIPLSVQHRAIERPGIGDDELLSRSFQLSAEDKAKEMDG
jgi:hypothetical protein